MNRRGFTLVELLGVIVILGILMLIAVPNVMSMVDKNKMSTYIADAEKLKTMAEYKIRVNTCIPLPTETEILVMPLSSINNGDLETDPEGNNYDSDKSYIAITKQDGFDEYWVNLVGIDGSKNRGIRLTKVDNLKADNRYQFVVKDFGIPTTKTEIASIMGNGKTVKKYAGGCQILTM